MRKNQITLFIVCIIAFSSFAIGNCSSKRRLLGDLDEEDVHEIETTSVIVGILTLICCLGCFGYYWYNKKQQYSQWINEDVPPYIVL